MMAALEGSGAYDEGLVRREEKVAQKGSYEEHWPLCMGKLGPKGVIN